MRVEKQSIIWMVDVVGVRKTPTPQPGGRGGMGSAVQTPTGTRTQDTCVPGDALVAIPSLYISFFESDIAQLAAAAPDF